MQFTTPMISLIAFFGVAAYAAPSPQVDAGCTASCAVWNGCRVVNAFPGGNINNCGPEPSRCNCQQFADTARAAIAGSQ
ncbi:hypothetical protein KVT40_004404 [Elsinoe batatas]|uniref:Uncharacterized protein n=1 Tax=Elsinoe batatas TaxID=2601811 RepID=A0A8K0PG32_9PEZI|nr:hypothetical protein KVT40_004404 [Elsinoe batatas]